MADLVVNDLALRYGENEILRGVSVNVPPGKVVALLGPSGSGKTTLLRAVAGLETPHRGTIAIGEKVFFDAGRQIDLPAEQRGLGLVFQSYALWPHRTVFDNVAYGLKLRKVATADIKTRVEKAMAQIGLGLLGERDPHQLSGGQQQRVALARAVVAQPSLVIADEPTGNLDVETSWEMMDLFADIAASGTAVLIATHNVEIVRRLQRRVITLVQGRLVRDQPAGLTGRMAWLASS
jgi:iron(III) transport system ATP-binding protein